jgi:cardiolipin synthase
VAPPGGMGHDAAVPELSPAWWYAIAALDVVVIGRALLRRHGAQGTLAWILAIIAFPVIGALAFLMLGAPVMRRRPKRARRARAPLPPQVEPQPTSAGPVLAVAERLTRLPPSVGNTVTLMTRTEDGFTRIERCLEQATTSIWAEYYIIRNDETGRRFVDLLTERARAGVEVCLLYDAVGSWLLDNRRLAALRDAGARLAAFLPVNPLRRDWSANLRNHRKLVVVDGEIGFTGGMNVGDEYSGRALRRGGLHFRDTHLELRGPAVSDLAATFAEDWAFATDETLTVREVPPLEDGTCTVAIVPSGPHQPTNASAMAYFTGIATARHRVWLSCPYFVPDGATLRALSSAAIRGCDVRVLVPKDNDIRIVGAAGRSYYGELLRVGVRIFEYRPSMLHAKSMVVDGAWSFVGSANIDIRSFQLNFELGALVADRAFADILEHRFEEELADSDEIDLEAWSSYGMARRLAHGVARLFTPMM